MVKGKHGKKRVNEGDRHSNSANGHEKQIIKERERPIKHLVTEDRGQR